MTSDQWASRDVAGEVESVERVPAAQGGAHERARGRAREECAGRLQVRWVRMWALAETTWVQGDRQGKALAGARGRCGHAGVWGVRGRGATWGPVGEL